MKIIENLKNIWNAQKELEKLRHENDNLYLRLSNFENRLNEDYYDKNDMTDAVKDIVSDELSDFDPDLDYYDIAERVNEELDYGGIADEVKDRVDLLSDDNFLDLRDRVYELEIDKDLNPRIDEYEKRVNDIREGLDKSMEFIGKFLDLYREYREKSEKSEKSV